MSGARVACEAFGVVGGTCSGHGTCTDAGVCACAPGWTGHDSFGTWPQDCHVDELARRVLTYVQLGNVCLLAVFIAVKLLLLWRAQSTANAAVRMHVIGLIVVLIAVANYACEAAGLYVAVNAPNPTMVLLGLAIGGFYLATLEFALLFFDILRDIGVVHVSSAVRRNITNIVRVLQVFDVLSHTSQTIVLGALRGGNASIFEVSAIVIAIAGLFGFNATTTGVVMVYEMLSIRRFLMRYHKDHGVSRTKDDRASILSKVKLLLMLSVAVTIVSPSAAIAVIAWYPARRYGYILEFLLVSGLTTVAWLVFAYVLDLRTSPPPTSNDTTVMSDATDAGKRKRRPGSGGDEVLAPAPAAADRPDLMIMTALGGSSGALPSPREGRSSPRGPASPRATDSTVDQAGSLPKDDDAPVGSPLSGGAGNLRQQRLSQSQVPLDAIGLATDRPRSAVDVREEEIDLLPPAARFFANEEIGPRPTMPPLANGF